MLKLFFRAKELKSEKKNSVAPVYTALLSMILCMFCLAGTTWAWFTANQDIAIKPLSSAQYGIHVSVAGEGYTEGQHEENARFYTLSPNQSYCITLTPAEDNTATTGYCLISVANQVYYTSPITAQTAFTFTYQTGVEAPEGVTAAGYEALVSEAKTTSLVVAWYWGTYPNTQNFTTSQTPAGYMPVENGAVLGTAPGEAPQGAKLTLELTGFALGQMQDLIALGEDYQLILTLSDGYELPEVVTVEIDDVVYEVYTDGLEHRKIPVDEDGNPDPQYLNEEGKPDLSLLPPMPTFDPTTNTLTIPAVLLTGDIQAVTIKASAVEIEEPECICATKCAQLNGDCPVCKDTLDGCLGTEAEETDPMEETTEPAEPAEPTAPEETTAPTEPVSTEPPATTEPAATDPPETSQPDNTET